MKSAYNMEHLNVCRWKWTECASSTTAICMGTASSNNIQYFHTWILNGDCTPENDATIQTKPNHQMYNCVHYLIAVSCWLTTRVRTTKCQFHVDIVRRLSRNWSKFTCQPKSMYRFDRLTGLRHMNDEHFTDDLKMCVRCASSSANFLKLVD